jgi:hypothetical protein
MFRTASASIALGLALAGAGLAALPASAQGTVREHRGDTPPAPKPTVDRDHRTVKPPPPAPTPGVRDHRTTYSRELTPKQPVQWELRGMSRIQPNIPYAIYNLRRTEQGKEAQLAFKETPGDTVGRDATGWGPNGGLFEFRRAPAPTDKGAIVADEYLAIYNTKTKRFMEAYGVWADAPQYVWQLRGLQANAGETAMSFALYNVPIGRYLVLWDQSLNAEFPTRENDLALIKGPGRID